MFVKTFKESSPLAPQEPVTLIRDKHRGEGTLSKVKRGRKYLIWEEYLKYSNQKEASKDEMFSSFCFRFFHLFKV